MGEQTVEKLTAKEAAAEVLRRAGEPLKADEIGKRVLELKGMQLRGKTPIATVSAILASENTKPDGLFTRTAPGTYTLREQKRQ
jgi:hypothetical protein